MPGFLTQQPGLKLAVPIARASMAAGADGIMVEVHNAPQFALSDSDQQLDFQQFEALMDGVFQ